MSGLHDSEVRAALQVMDKDREIETLRARIAELEAENERLEMAYKAAGESAVHEHERAEALKAKLAEIEGVPKYDCGLDGIGVWVEPTPNGDWIEAADIRAILISEGGVT